MENILVVARHWEGNVGGRGVVVAVKGTTWGIFVVMKKFCPLTVSMSISWLCYCGFARCCSSGELGKGYMASLCIIYLFIYLFGHTTWHAGSQFPDQGSNPRPLQWKRGVLTTGLPGKSPLCVISTSLVKPWLMHWGKTLNKQSKMK